MTVSSASLKVDCCYRMMSGDAFKIAAFDGSRVIYVVEHNGIYPIWNRAMWHATSKADFAKQVIGEIVCR